MISVLILTLNEELNLPRCLASLGWCDDVVVLDSLSSDGTQDIAIDGGARVFERSFDNYAAQRNYGLKEISYKHPWVLMVDADEVVPSELLGEMRSAIAQADRATTLYRMRRKDHFLGKWIKRSSGYPTWFGRLVRPDEVKVEREINEEYVTDGQVAQLQEHLIHYPFSKGITYWFERHNRYSSMEAKALVDEARESIPWRDVFSGDPTARRKALKQLAYRLPCRPWLVFAYLLFFRLGFLDGRPGLAYATMRKSYETMIDLKVMELKRREKHKPI
ncbi:glycosyltransferase family 2 protein [Pseudohalioglobus sediminis]|uniref:glycosyltransferase family 2 protein n=1 Tax=Pseudohalioglobus sediminis TaxID=2606449 RepID=UPI00165FFC5A|nr:glycosyltransferase family 2 protein [Pseudohalioglobus sediminis]